MTSAVFAGLIVALLISHLRYKTVFITSESGVGGYDGGYDRSKLVLAD